MIQKDIANILEANNLGIFGRDIFLNRLADKPNNAIAINLLPGFPFSPKRNDVTYSFQIILRSTDYEKAYIDSVKIADIFDGGESRYNVAPSGRKMVCRLLNAPYSFNIDESNRIYYSINFYVTTNRD